MLLLLCIMTIHQSPGWYGPGPQFILELRPFLSDHFKEDIVDCKLCKEPVIRVSYYRCQKLSSMGTVYHVPCAMTNV